MTKIYAEIPKFKRIEASLRATTVSYRKVMDEIDKASSGQRTDEERKLLQKIRQECLELQQKTRDLITNLYIGVEGHT